MLNFFRLHSFYDYYGTTHIKICEVPHLDLSWKLYNFEVQRYPFHLLRSEMLDVSYFIYESLLTATITYEI